MDISGFFNWFLDMFIGVIARAYGFLDNITFAGISLLQFILWCLILSAIIPIIFSVARTQSGSMHRNVEAHNREVQRQRNRSGGKSSGSK